MVNPFSSMGRTAKQRWTLATLAGILNGIAFIHWGAFTLVANVPLLLALRTATRYRDAALLAGWVGILGGAHIYGILDYGWWIFIAFSLYTGSQMILYGLLFHGLWIRQKPVMSVVLPAVIWGLTEWLRTVGPICMPASYVGNIADVVALRPWLVMSAFIGGLGVSTLLALVQSVLFHLCIGTRAQRIWSGWAALLFLAAGGFGYLSMTQAGGQERRVIGVQGGLSNDRYDLAQFDPLAMRDIVDTYGSLTQASYARGADFVIWPETAVRAPVMEVDELKRRLLPQSSDRSVLLAGLQEHDSEGRQYNSVLAIEAGGTVVDRYRKVRLVPGTESRFTPGEGHRPMWAGQTSIGVMICLESVYPNVARELVSRGARFLVVSSNDAGFGRSPITHHMTNRARVRAAETRRWLVRVGQAGVSAVIDPNGRIRRSLDLFEPGLLDTSIELREEATLYVRWGNWWVWVLFILLGWAWYARHPVPGAPKTDMPHT